MQSMVWNGMESGAESHFVSNEGEGNGKSGSYTGTVFRFSKKNQIPVTSRFFNDMPMMKLSNSEKQFAFAFSGRDNDAHYLPSHRSARSSGCVYDKRSMSQ